MFGNGNGNDSNSSNELLGKLQKRIAQLDFLAFLICVAIWLGSRNYRGITSLGRWAKRGRRSNGGADLLAFLPCSEMVQLAIQIKDCQTPVPKQAVDGLRGYMVRHGVTFGLIVAKQRFSDKAAKAATVYSGRPIELISIRQFARSLFEQGLGVRVNNGILEIDDQFFMTLEHLRFANLPWQGSAQIKTESDSHPIDNVNPPSETALLSDSAHTNSLLETLFFCFLVFVAGFTLGTILGGCLP